MYRNDTGMTKNPEIEINGVPIIWDTDRGTFSFFGLSSALFWINPSLLTMLQPIAKEIGTDLFRLMVAHSASKGTEEDYHAMVSVLADNFKDGFLNWGKAVSSAGWGTFEIPHFDQVNKVARVRISNTWELLLENDEMERWGCPFIQGKIIGIFNHAFDTNCWADEVDISYDPENAFVEFQVYESKRTIETEIENIKRQRLSEREHKLDEEVQRKTSELMHANEKLIQAKEHAELSGKVKSEFLGIMSHELRTPLNAMIGFSNIMNNAVYGPIQPEEYREYMVGIERSATVLLKMIDQILDVTLIESEKMKLNLEPVELGEVIDEVLSMRFPEEDGKSLDIRNLLNDPHKLLVDRKRIKRVFVNIISNAIKFTEAGSVTVENRCDDSGHNIIIQDTGIGMSAEEIEVAKESFRQVHGTDLSRPFQGTGIGLTYAQLIMEQHGGKLSITSDPGKGSTVTLNFPNESCVS